MSLGAPGSAHGDPTRPLGPLSSRGRPALAEFDEPSEASASLGVSVVTTEPGVPEDGSERNAPAEALPPEDPHGNARSEVPSIPAGRASWARRVLPPAAAGAALVLFVCVVAAGPVVGDHEEFSALDGRSPVAFPEPSVGAVRDGSWMQGVEAWMDDHVAARTQWLTLHGTLASRGLSVPVIENVLVDDPQGMQLEKVKRLKVPRAMPDHARRLGEDVRAAGVPILWVYVPRKEEVFADRLPSAWPDNLGATRPKLISAMEQGGPVLDLTPTLSAPDRRDGYYWRTDHHWTPAGALAGIDAVVERAASLGVDIPQDTRPYPTRSFPDFYGSTGRKVTAGATRRPDHFAIPAPDQWRANSCVKAVCDTPTFVEEKAANPEKYANRYAAFMGGDFGYQRILNNDPAARGTVLLIKDSFGDAFSTYFAERVRNLVTIDERHYGGKEIRDLVRTLQPDIVIVMHNQVSVLGNVSFDSQVWVDVAGAKRDRAQGDG